MRKRSEQVYSRESSATLQLTVSLLYPFYISALLFGNKRAKISEKSQSRKDKGVKQICLTLLSFLAFMGFRLWLVSYHL